MQVTFLYNLTAGACPKSYGVNVARLAGLPSGVVNRSAAFAAQLEEQHGRQPALSSHEQARLQKLCHAVQHDQISPQLQTAGAG